MYGLPPPLRQPNPSAASTGEPVTRLGWFVFLLVLLQLSILGGIGLAEEPIKGGPSRWALEVGMAAITEKTIDQLFEPGETIARGDAGGHLINLTVYYILTQFEWRMGKRLFLPSIEIPFRLTVVDENGQNPFLDFNAGLLFRWVDFPWNRIVSTTIGTGIGISYSEKVFTVDRKNHPDQNRSHLKVDWPIQITLAHPRLTRHQMVLFIDHQSGARLFDRGGVNSLGIGYRYRFQ